MQAKRATFVGLLIIIMIIGGCSNKDMVTGPEASVDENYSSVQPDETNQSLTKKAQVAMQRISFDAVLHKIDIEGGCWYLETGKGEKFEPYFENEEKVRYEGMELRVSGYVDKKMATYCMIAPVFRIEKHVILSKVEKGDEGLSKLNSGHDNSVENQDISNLSSDKPAPDNEPADKSKPITVTGIVSQVDYPKGCIFVYTKRVGTLELKFRATADIPDLSNGSVKASIAGRINPDIKSNCVEGFVLEVEDLKVLDYGKGTGHEATSSLSGSSSKPLAMNTKPRPMIKLRGHYGTTESGCLYLKGEKETIELFFVPGICPNIEEGALIEVTGVYSMLTVSNCQLGPRFNVHSFSVIDDKLNIDARSSLTWHPKGDAYIQQPKNLRADY